MKTTRAIVFDLDGTLLDVRDGFYWQFQELTKIYDGYPVSRERISSAAWGTTEQIVRRLVRNGNIPLEEILRTHQKLRLQAYDKHLQLYNGAEDLLYELSHRGMRLAALTAGNFLTVSCLDRTKIRKYFHLIVTADHVLQHKPHPEGLLMILQDLDVKPEETIMVGDTAADILTGKNAGVGKTIGLLHGFGKKFELQQANADHLVGDIGSILKLIP